MPEENMTADEAVEEGKRLHQAGNLAEAEAIYRRILETSPEHAESIHFIGVLALQRREMETAVALLRRADALRPNNGGYLSNLGVALLSLGENAEAAEVLARAVQARPDLATAFSNLGTAYKKLGRFDEAVAACERGLELNPRAADAHHALGGVLFEIGQANRAIELMEMAVAINPGLTDIDSARLFMLGTDPSFDAKRILAETRAWSARQVAGLKIEPRPFVNERSAERRLRIGYVSGDFREHSVARFILPLLRNHDRSAVEIFCYSNNKTQDAMTAALREAADAWRDVTLESDDRAAEMIRQDRIDVLVDLSLHTGHNRLLVFARRPAPVQVSYLAYCGTTGLEAMDYRLSDALIDPPGTDESVYSEKTVRLPGCYWCYEANEKVPEIGESPALAKGCVTFGSLNNFFKVNQQVLAAWAEILRQAPGSRLILSCPPGRHRELVMHALGDRVEFAERMLLEDYFNLFQRIDVALDTFPYAGGTTTCDALWMGVPVVTIAGKTGVGRGGVSLLKTLGAAELIAADVRDYVSNAVSLANDVRRITEYRQSLRARMKASALMDVAGFTRGVEAAYRDMWRKWCTR